MRTLGSSAATAGRALVFTGLLGLCAAAPAASAPSSHAASAPRSVTLRIRSLDSWTHERARGAEQVTTWFLDRPQRGCTARMTGSGRQVIEFWEPERALTLLQIHGSHVSPATIPVQARVTRFGTATLHLDELPYSCTGDRGRAKGPITMGTPDPNWSGSEHVAADMSGPAAPMGMPPGYPGWPGSGALMSCGTITGTVDLHLALRGRGLHMTGEFATGGEPPFTGCPFFFGALPQQTPQLENRLALLPIDLPLDSSPFDPHPRDWVGVNVKRQANHGLGIVPTRSPLIQRYLGDPHGATVEDVSFQLQHWPPRIYGRH